MISFFKIGEERRIIMKRVVILILVF